MGQHGVLYCFLQPKVILSASVGIEPNRTIDYKELLDKAIDMSEHKPPSCVIYNRPQVSIGLGTMHCQGSK